LAGQARHDSRPRRRRGRRLHRRRADGRPRPQPRLRPRHRLDRLPDDAADGDAEAERHPLLGRHPRGVRGQPADHGLAPAQPRQLRRRRHRRRPRDARLLRRARHRRRGRDGRARSDQSGLRPPRPQRRPLPLRHRHGCHAYFIVTFTVLVVFAPSVATKATLTVTFTLPLAARVCFSAPFKVIGSVTVPAFLTLTTTVFRPGPLTVTLPGPETSTFSVAFPLPVVWTEPVSFTVGFGVVAFGGAGDVVGGVVVVPPPLSPPPVA